jgi:hypothetical protein
MEDICEGEKYAVTDRYIPSRKLMKADSLFAEDE